MLIKPKKIIDIFICLIAIVFGLTFLVNSASANVSSAFTSQIKDTGQAISSWGNIDWTTVQPSAATQIVLKARSCNDAACSGETAFSSCTALATITSANAAGSAAMSGNACIVAGDRYIQYEAALSTTDNTVTPTLSSVTLNYTGAASYPTSRWLISSKYQADAGMNDNRLSSITWNQTNPANTSVEFQVRTASSAVDLDSAPWCGPDDGVGGSCSSATHFTVNTGQTIDDLNRDGTNDQWIQYKIFLVSDGSGTPVLNDVSLGYSNNLTGNFTSSSYNTEQTYNVPSQLIWNETIPADITNNQSIRVQVATSPDNSSWTSFVGPGDNTSTYYDVSNSTYCSKVSSTVTCNIPQISVSDGYSDRWVKYKVYFDATSGNMTSSPSLTGFTFKYDQNTPPTIAVTSVSQLASGADIGKVSAGYNISDAEQTSVNVSILADIGVTLAETLGATATEPDGQIQVSSITLFPSSGTIQIDNEQITYTGKSGSYLTGAVRAANSSKYDSHTSGAAVWIKGVSVSGNAGALTGITSTPAAKTVLWDIQTDLPGVYKADAKIRVSANDSQIGNPVGAGDSTTFALDTVAPAASGQAVIVSSTSSTGNLTVSITEPSTWYMRFANVPNNDGTACSTLLYNQPDSGATAYQASGVSATLYPLSPNTNGASTVCYEFKDTYNNKLQGSASTPVTPANVKAGDTSYGGLQKYRNLVWWTLSGSATKYYIKRCEIASTDASTKCDSDSNYSAFAVIDSASQNYCFDKNQTAPLNAANCLDDTIAEAGPTGLTTTSKYCYRIMAEKADGSSPYSNIDTVNTCSRPTGDLTGKSPEISQPSILTGPAPDGTTLNTYTTATITWTTDIDSYSLVKYSTDSSLLTGVSTAGSTVNQAAASHSVELTGLEPGTVYYYQAISGVSGGASSIDTSAIKNFTTKVPSINSTPETSASFGQTYANITWTTDAPATSVVYYAAGIVTAENLLLTVPITNTEKVASHNILISSITPLTEYSYLVKSFYGPSNAGVLTSAVGTFTTLTNAVADTVAPVISAVSCDGVEAPGACTPAGATATIAWTTTDAANGNANSYSIVEYNIGASLTANSMTAGSLVVDPTPASPVSHSVVLSGIVSGTQYSYRVHSGDAFGNLATSSVYTFGTNAAPVISGLTVSSYDRTSAVISWTTDKPSYSQIEYSKDSANSANLNTATALITPLTPTTETNVKVTQHTVVLANLDQATDYYFRAVSNDGVTASTKSNISSFTTTGGTVPVITFGSAGTPGENSIAITFKSSVSAFLSVMYTTDAVTTASADSAYSGAASLMASPDTNVTITLNGLASGTAYNYRLTARDIYGNAGRENQIRTFTTASDTAAPVITFNSTTGIVAASTTATITWTTSEPATGRVDYGETISYGSNVADADTTNTDHTITLTGLTAGTSYYYKLTSADAAGNPRVDDNSGAGYTFTTAPVIPIIDASPAAVKTSTTATITWTTNNVKSSSLVDFGTTLSYGTTQGNSSYLVTSHEVNLVGLTPGTVYKYRIKSVDTFGNTVTDDNSGQGYAFTTDSLSASGAVPGISSVYSESITSSSAVIRWTTAESSDSLVGYGIVSGAYKFETGSSGQSTIHAVALTGLSPSTTYYYRVKSRTAANQLETEEDAAYTFATLAGTEKIPPVISGISVSSATSNKATIAWTTDENSSSLVDFGTALGVYTSTQGNPADSTGTHSVEVKSLTPATAYYFRVRSVDASGNSASAVGDGFSTTAGAAVDCPATGSSRPSCPEPEVCPTVDKAAPKITNIKISDIAFNTATVGWETDENANSMIVYDTVSEGVKKVFNYSAGQSKDAVKLHTVILRGLDSNTPYYFKVSSTDSSGNTADSDQQTFTTLSITQAKDKGMATAESLKKQFEDIAKTLVKDNLATEENIKDIISRIANPPLISQEGPIVKDIKSYGATIYWQTDRKSNSVVKFTVSEDKDKPLLVGSNWREISRTDTYDTRHEVSLLGLAPSTTYSFQVLSRDVLGNIASSEIKSFTTSSSSSIFNVAITNLGLTAATINWETANLSTTTLEWGLESTYGNYKDKGEEKAKKHNISIDNLSSGTTYHYRVRSVEEAGSILVSDDYTFITPELPQITKYSLGEVKDNAVSLVWTSNIPIDSTVRYTNRENNETKVQVKEEKATDHALTVSNLEAGKTYSIEIQGRDDQGNLASVPAFDVQTGMDVIIPEISQVRSQSAIISGGEEKVQTIISWKTNELASTQVLWDIGATKGDTFANETKADTNLTTSHIAVITQFKAGTVYRYRVVSADKFGNIAKSQDYTILTPVKRQSIIQMIVNQFESIFGWVSRIGK